MRVSDDDVVRACREVSGSTEDALIGEKLAGHVYWQKTSDTEAASHLWLTASQLCVQVRLGCECRQTCCLTQRQDFEEAQIDLSDVLPDDNHVTEYSLQIQCPYMAPISSALCRADVQLERCKTFRSSVSL